MCGLRFFAGICGSNAGESGLPRKATESLFGSYGNLREFLLVLRKIFGNLWEFAGECNLGILYSSSLLIAISMIITSIDNNTMITSTNNTYNMLITTIINTTIVITIIITAMTIIMYSRFSLTPSPPIMSLHFRGFDSSKLSIIVGGNSHVRRI